MARRSKAQVPAESAPVEEPEVQAVEAVEVENTTPQRKEPAVAKPLSQHEINEAESKRRAALKAKVKQANGMASDLHFPTLGPASGDAWLEVAAKAEALAEIATELAKG